MACSVPGCGEIVRAKGLCEAHYRRHRVGAPLEPIRRRRPHAAAWEALKAAAAAYGSAATTLDLINAERALAEKARAWAFDEYRLPAVAPSGSRTVSNPRGAEGGNKGEVRDLPPPARVNPPAPAEQSREAA